MKLFGKNHLEELDLERKVNLSLWRSLFVLCVVIIILAASLLNLKDGVNVIIKTPPSSSHDSERHIIYNLNGANITYYELWGKYLVDNYSNIAIDTVSDKFDSLINQMRPSRALKKINEIDKFKEDVLANRISQKFTPVKVSLDMGSERIAKTATYTVLGIAEQAIGNKKEDKKECSYTFIMEFNEGVFYVENFGTDCF